MKLIDTSLMQHDEIEWVNGYHARVREQLTPLLQVRNPGGRLCTLDSAGLLSLSLTRAWSLALAGPGFRRRD